MFSVVIYRIVTLQQLRMAPDRLTPQNLNYLGTKSGALAVALPTLLATPLGTPENETPLEPATCPASTGFHAPAVGGRVLGRVGPDAP